MPPPARRFALLALTLAACGGPDPAEDGAPEPAAIEQASPCEAACESGLGMAGIRFKNSADGARHVYVDGALVCTLEQDETCTTSVPAGVESVVHVTDTSDGIVCKGDATSTLGACVCMTVEIFC